MKNLLHLFRRAKLHCAVDLGTEVVKAAAVRKQGGVSTVSGYAQNMYTPHDVVLGAFSEVGDARDVIAKTIREACGGALPDALEVILGRTSGASCVTRKEYERDKPEKPVINEELATMRADLEQSCREQFASQEYRGSFGSQSPLFLEEIAQEYSLDGYPTESPLGNKGKTLGICGLLYGSFLTHQEITRKLFEAFPSAKIRFLFEPSLVLDLVRMMVHEHRVMLIMDWGGVAVQWFFAKERNIEGIHFFPQGGHHLSEKISKANGVSMFEAEELKRAYLKKELSSEAMEPLHRLSGEFFRDLFDRLAQELAAFLPKEHIISDIVLMGGSVPPEDFQEEFFEILKSDLRIPLAQHAKFHVSLPSSILKTNLSFPDTSQNTLLSLALRKTFQL